MFCGSDSWRFADVIFAIRSPDLCEFTAFIAVDGAKFVAGGAVFFLLGDGGQVGEMVGGGHGDEAGPEAGEGGVVVEVRVVFGVDVEEVERPWIVGDRLLYMAEEAAQEGELEGVKEEGEGGFEGEGVGGRVGVMEEEGGECVGLYVLVPEGDVGVGGACEVGVELDAFDAEEGKLGGEEQGAAFAGANVEEDGALDRLRGGAMEPDV
jgi:hypothetical protein